MLSRFSRVRLFATHAPLSMRFSRQEYWSGFPYPFPGDLPNPKIKPASFASPALAGGFFTTSARPRPHTQQDFPAELGLPRACPKEGRGSYGKLVSGVSPFPGGVAHRGVSFQPVSALPDLRLH